MDDPNMHAYCEHYGPMVMTNGELAQAIEVVDRKVRECATALPRHEPLLTHLKALLAEQLRRAQIPQVQDMAFTDRPLYNNNPVQVLFDGNDPLAICEDTEIGRRWRQDNSLGTWFPMAAQQLRALREENERLRELADSEGTRAVEYLRRARKAEVTDLGRNRSRDDATPTRHAKEQSTTNASPKQTPGPWAKFGDEIYGSDGTRIAEAVAARDMLLLLAAPDLAVALRDLVDVMTGQDEGDTAALHNAQAALAKAGYIA